MRVLVVDDSAYQRLALSAVLRALEPISAVESASSGESALRKLLDGSFDLMTLDIEMPGMDGFSVLRWVMENRPLPVLVVTSLHREEVALKALELGAFEVLVKPAISVAGRSEWRSRLARGVDTVAHLKVDALLRHSRSTRADIPRQEPAPRSIGGWLDPPHARKSALVVAASTGGPAALRELFSSFPRRPVVVGIVLHIPAPFTKSLAARLESSSGWRAREARDGEAAEDGTILVAPAGHHMEFVGRKGNTVVRIRGATSLDKWVPSADSLFSSAATVFGPELVAVVLTGMGNDGTIGATDVSAAGGCVIAESSETAVISGMPEATACAVPKTTRLPLGQIGAELSGHFPLATLTRFHE